MHGLFYAVVVIMMGNSPIIGDEGRVHVALPEHRSDLESNGYSHGHEDGETHHLLAEHVPNVARRRSRCHASRRARADVELRRESVLLLDSESGGSGEELPWSTVALAPI